MLQNSNSRLFTFLFLVLCNSIVFSQTLDEARMWFEKYEYKKAALSYAKIAEYTSLSNADLESQAYAYFIIGDYEKSAPIVDSIINRSTAPPFFYFMHAEISMANGSYTAAKESYEKYQLYKPGINLKSKIESCELRPSWSPISDAIVDSKSFNSTKAEINGGFYKNKNILFKEVGYDSLKSLLNFDEIDKSELVLMKPYLEVEGQNDVYKLISYIENDWSSISSLTFIPNTNKVLLTMSKPLSEKELDKAPHIYSGIYNPLGEIIDSIKPWIYSGYEDSTSCSNPVINSTNDIIVFTKIGSETRNADLFISKFSSGEWGKPLPINQLNTDLDEMYPSFVGDSLFIFSSNGYPGYGGLDIYNVNSNDFSDFNHYKEPINTYMDDFNLNFFAKNKARFTSNRIGGAGDDDVYTFTFEKKVNVEVSDSVDLDDFIDNWSSIKVYFNFDQFNLNEDIPETNKLVSILKKYNLSIILEGHADRRGSDRYNYDLGYKRASAVKDELIQKGVNPESIELLSKGKEDPPFDCSSGCSEKDHSKNRFVLIKLIIPKN